MRARLLGLVLLPSIGLCVFGAHEVTEQRALAHEADELVVGVEAAAAAFDAYVIATHEYRLAEIAEQAAAFGLSTEAAGELLGLDLVRELEAVGIRSAKNPVLRRLVEEAGGRKTATPGLGPSLGAERSAEVMRQAMGEWTSSRKQMIEAGGGPALRDDLRRAIHAFRTTATLFETSDEELLAVSQRAIPGSATELPTAGELDALAARYRVLSEQVAEDVDEHVAPVVGRLADNRDFDRLVAETRALDRVAAPDELGDLFRLGLARNRQVEGLAVATADDAIAHALEVGEAAQTAYRRTLVLVLGAVMATLVLAVVVAKSIDTPLRRLARRAAEVSNGELDGEPIRPTGPRETAALAETLNDATESLRRVEHQLAALATGEAETAAAAPPGKLGALVARSVEGLAASIAEREQLQQRLAYEAAHDALTGLANRRTAMAEIDGMLAAGQSVGLLFLDLDGFKAVNDEQGHAAGDALLRIAAQRLESVAPASALVARLGGDEFVLALVIDDEQEAVDLAWTITRLLDEDALVAGLRRRVAVSVGVAVSHPGDDSDRLMRSADAALYEAKRAGRGGVVVLDDQLRAEIEAEHLLEAELRAAIDAGHLEVFYQPVFAAAGGLHGVEALVRWRREDRTLVPPDHFVPAAERNGLIVDLDRWVLEAALAQIDKWRRGPFPGLRLSVNVSARTLLSTGFVDEVAVALDRAGVPGGALVVEVTETALLHDLDTAADHITALRELGVSTSVDDFGTGYTSLSHLRRLPVTEVKIDRSFVHGMGGDDRDLMLVDLIARIARVLSLDVVAEGVETQAQLNALRALGCQFAQGYLLGRPVPAAELEATVLASRSLTP